MRIRIKVNVCMPLKRKKKICKNDKSVHHHEGKLLRGGANGYETRMTKDGARNQRIVIKVLKIK